jgi:4-amino-4-deoxy-L-arabinose transferase-like glycosyltransferase
MLDTRVVLLLLFVGSLFLRLFHIETQSLWLDEIASLASSGYSRLFDVVRATLFTERIPPLYPILLHSVIKIFGLSEIALRLPSALCGALSVLVLFTFVKNVFNYRTALCASLLLAISPYHVWYSQEGRFFSLFVLIHLLSVYFFMKLLYEEKMSFRTNLFILTIVNILALCVNYFMIFSLVAQNVVFFINRKFVGSNLKKWLYAQIVIFVLCLPLIVPLAKQSYIALKVYMHSSSSHQRATESHEIENKLSMKDITDSLKNRVRFAFKETVLFAIKDVPFAFSTGLKYLNTPPYHWSRLFQLVYILPSMAFFSVFFFVGIRHISNRQIGALFVLFALPIFAVCTMKLSNLDVRALETRHIIHVLPLFYCFVSLGVLSFRATKQKIIVMSMVLISCVSLSVYYFDQRTYKDDWRFLVREVMDTVRSEDAIIFHGEFSRLAFMYYVKNNSDYANKWNTLDLHTFEIRGRDGSFREFVYEQYRPMLAEINNLYFISYYGLPEEIEYFRETIQHDLKLLNTDDSLGKRMIFELYKKA